MSTELNRRAVLTYLSAILPMASVPTATTFAGIVPPTTPAALWPSGWHDPRFAANTASGPRYNTGSQIVTWRGLTVIDQSG